MKKIIFLLSLCLLMVGCTADPVEETTLPTGPQAVEFVEPTGIYDPDSAIETATDGAIRSYPLDMTMVYRVESMGDRLLVFSGAEETTLTCLAGENLYIHARAELPFRLSGRTATQVTEKGVSYLDPNTREVVFLDTSLKEIKRFMVPEDLVGTPVMSPSRQIMYYCTPDSVRALDLETGIRRLMKQIAYPEQSLDETLLDGTVVQCAVSDEAGNRELLFIDTQTGETLARTHLDVTVTSRNGEWYAVFTEGSVQSMVYSIGQETAQLSPTDISAKSWYLTEHNAALSASGLQDVTLEYYDLESGLRTASVKLEGNPGLWCVLPGAEKGLVWLVSTDPESELATIYRWDAAKTPVADETVYTGPRYTKDAPDTKALENCREAARALGERYGVEILIGAEATEVQPWDYSLEMEYSAPVISLQLERLEEILAWCPVDFFTKAAATTESGRLKICIVRSLTGTPVSGSLETAPGTQFWIDEEAYLVVAAGDTFQSTFCHVLLHAAETLVYAESHLYDDWDWLNPEGFAYDFDYIANESRDGSEYLQEKTRAFIDTYSMSFPKEDRARIMEYAMMEGNESYFQSNTMQQKLRVLCQGIREAFGWKKSEESFRWEQYLEESLAYQKK